MNAEVVILASFLIVVALLFLAECRSITTVLRTHLEERAAMRDRIAAGDSLVAALEGELATKNLLIGALTEQNDLQTNLIAIQYAKIIDLAAAGTGRTA